jgi:SAM-dependent methyltransferase
MDALAGFKAAQREAWAHFAPLEAVTTRPAARLVRFSGLGAKHKVLDVACGTGVVAVTAARLGARVSGLDLTPQLLERARENARIAGVAIEWHEGDAEALPFDAGAFDVVVSQFGHMFAPRPAVVLAEMLRVLAPGGTLAFSTWPPELFTGRMFALNARYQPPPPAGVSPPVQWGDPNVVRERLGSAVKDLVFDRDTMFVPALSPAHQRENFERSSGPAQQLVQTLQKTDPQRLESYRREYEALVAEYLDGNTVRQDYLLTRATKVSSARS